MLLPISELGTRDINETEDRVICVMRIALTFSAQLILFINPTKPETLSEWVSAVLSLYTIYSLLLLYFAKHRSNVKEFSVAWAHWVDVGWCVVLVFLSGRLNSIFFIGFLFPMLVASLRWGFIAGLRVTIVSAFSFVAITLIPPQPLVEHVEINRMLVKAIWLLGLGYLMAHWGETEITVKRRLQLLEDVSEYSNPRFGIGQTVGSILKRLKDYYSAQSCLMVFNDSDGGGFRLQRTNDRDPEAASQAEPIDREFALRLLELSPDSAAVYRARPEGWWRLGSISQIWDLALGRLTAVDHSTFASLATVLDARHFVTAPLQYRNENLGRLYVVARNPAFVPSDMLFLHKIVDHANPIIQNIRLVEQLASHAADEERRKIARDIHDSVIQPYLGLQIGLAAIREKAGEHGPELAKQVEHLMDVAQMGVNDLRRYVAGLKESEESGGLLPAMRRFAGKFTEATGISVQIETEGDLRASDRLATEAFQMTAEGLSNIRKHTQATRATVRLACRLGHLILEIANEGRPGATPVFTPVSITERAAALGGKVRIKSLPEGGSSVVIDIPL